jgi:hypothetical protein
VDPYFGAGKFLPWDSDDGQESWEEVPIQQIWRCRALVHRLRCGEPCLAEDIEGLPEFLLLPHPARKGRIGDTKEIECDMIALYDGDPAWRDGRLGRLHILGCDEIDGPSWMVLIEPLYGASHDFTDACQRFSLCFAAALAALPLESWK